MYYLYSDVVSYLESTYKGLMGNNILYKVGVFVALVQNFCTATWNPGKSENTLNFSSKDWTTYFKGRGYS